MDHPDFIAFRGLKQSLIWLYLSNIFSPLAFIYISLKVHVVNMSLNMYGTQYGLSQHNKLLQDVEV